jgi:hypothetical protein
MAHPVAFEHDDAAGVRTDVDDGQDFTPGRRANGHYGVSLKFKV